MKDKQLTLKEKWEIDIESYKMSGGMSVTVPQCKKCKYWIKTDVFHCGKYQKRKKPTSIIRADKKCPKFECIDNEINLHKA